MKLIHHSPAGALEIVGVDGIVEPGEPFEIPDEQAEGLLVQSDLYFRAPEPTPEPKGKK
ncbi:hypothetical protein [Cryobacterium fucosi]|uniref:hypothetical protein n=1 Tax=Cryobacterium fucosi TaxID=1259157 RepID=UPI00141B47AC|nr:hypothetical protein [Cryobacterium fucosi]